MGYLLGTAELMHILAAVDSPDRPVVTWIKSQQATPFVCTASVGAIATGVEAMADPERDIWREKVDRVPHTFPNELINIDFEIARVSDMIQRRLVRRSTTSPAPIAGSAMSPDPLSFLPSTKHAAAAKSFAPTCNRNTR